MLSKSALKYLYWLISHLKLIKYQSLINANQKWFHIRFEILLCLV